MKVFHAILQSALEFHLVSQSFSRRIGSHDRHHRSRNTVEDEYDVITACKGLEVELRGLWRRRPRVLDLTAKDLSDIISHDIAMRLDELFCVYIATFWAHFLYMHRVAWWDLPHSTTAKKALRMTWRLARRSVGEPEDYDENDASACTRPSPRKLHPGLMWPLYMLGCETPSLFEQQWTISQLQSLGEKNGSSGLEDVHDDALPLDHLEQKGTHNAVRVSVLLRETIERQNKTGARVDGKYLSLELFGCQFTII
jgi:hypothetical protein